MRDTFEFLEDTDFPRLQRSNLETLQVNLGYLCNQQCLHCHVNASPRRTEIMDKKCVDAILQFIKHRKIKTLDLTGGAPEMNPHFRYLVARARELEVNVIDRCNLTILTEDGYDWITDFLVENEVSVVASMPCYLAENVDNQRGKGVFDKSIIGLKKLNVAGYGSRDHLTLDLVFNPQGATLPPPQGELEQAYKKELYEKYGIIFNNLLTITNMPIKRFGSTLLSKGEFDQYMNLLKQSYVKTNLKSVMCRTLLSVDWQGYVYDCDFNQMLGMRSKLKNGKTHIVDLMDFDFRKQDIVVMDHCYGCTAGQGSSCGGAIA